MPTPAEPTRDSIISRVVRILSCFDRSTAALSLSSLARRSGLPLTEGWTGASRDSVT